MYKKACLGSGPDNENGSMALHYALFCVHSHFSVCTETPEKVYMFC